MTLDRNAVDRRRFARLLGVDGAQGSGLPVRARRRRSAATGSGGGSSIGDANGAGAARHRDEPPRSTAGGKIDGDRPSDPIPDPDGEADSDHDHGHDDDRDQDREGTRSISSRLVLRETR
ncbi:hypothetical protein [Natrarchaeobaculum aegyptiacum]|nr:hypothetical protein [Natrarchaeobaculum aegyptiacum]